MQNNNLNEKNFSNNEELNDEDLNSEQNEENDNNEEIYTQEELDKIEMLSSKDRKFFVYLRQSIKWRSEMSLELQEKEITNFAKNSLWLKKENLLFITEEASAYWWDNDNEEGELFSKNKNKIKREKFDKMMSELEEDSKLPINERKYWWSIFLNVSRMARNPYDFTRIWNIMQKWYWMYTVQEKIVDSPSWLLLFRILQAFSIYYSDALSEKNTMYKLKSLIDNLAIRWWKIPFWYKSLNKEIFIDKEEADIVKAVFDLYYENKVKKWNKYEYMDLYNDLKLNDKLNQTIIENKVKRKSKDDTRSEVWRIDWFVWWILRSTKIVPDTRDRTIRYNWEIITSQKIKFKELVNLYNSKDFLNDLKKKNITINTKEGWNAFKLWVNKIFIAQQTHLKIIESNKVYNSVANYMESNSRKYPIEAIRWGYYNWILKCPSCEWYIWGLKWWWEYRYSCKDKDCLNPVKWLREEFIDNYLIDFVFKFLKSDDFSRKYLRKIWEVFFTDELDDLKNKLKAEKRARTLSFEKHKTLEKETKEYEKNIKKSILEKEAEEYMSLLIKNKELTERERRVLWNIDRKIEDIEGRMTEIDEQFTEYIHSFDDLSSFFHKTKSRVYRKSIINRIINEITLNATEIKSDTEKTLKEWKNYWTVNKVKLEDLELHPFFNELYILNRFLLNNE